MQIRQFCTEWFASKTHLIYWSVRVCMRFPVLSRQAHIVSERHNFLNRNSDLLGFYWQTPTPKMGTRAALWNHQNINFNPLLKLAACIDNQLKWLIEWLWKMHFHVKNKSTTPVCIERTHNWRFSSAMNVCCCYFGNNVSTPPTNWFALGDKQ